MPGNIGNTSNNGNMKTIANTNYYNKQEAAEIIGVSVANLNARIVATRVDGYRLGKAKHYTEEQIKTLAEYRKPATQ